MPWTMTSRNTRPQLIRPALNFRAHVALLVTRSFRPQIISPSPSKHISTTTPKVKESPWLSEDSTNTDICIDSDRDNREKNTNVCVTSAEPEFTLKHMKHLRIPMGLFTFTKEVHYTHTLFQFLLSLSYTSITLLNHYRTQKPMLP